MYDANEYKEIIVNVENTNRLILRTEDNDYTLDFKKLLKDYGIEKHPKVFDADGICINVGDTVWHEDGTEYLVQDIDTNEEYSVYVGDGWYIDPAYLTHQKPDTQKALDEDVASEATELSYLYVNGAFNGSEKWIRIDKVEEFLERQRKIDVKNEH